MRTISYYFLYNLNMRKAITFIWCLVLFPYLSSFAQTPAADTGSIYRQRISINEGWRFYKYDSLAKADDLIYDVRPDIKDYNDARPADAKPTEATDVKATQMVLKTMDITNRQ